MITTTASRTWISESILEVNDTRFYFAADPSDYMNAESNADSFVLVKDNREMVDHMVRLVDDLQPDRIVEIGIFKGGSAALLANLRPTAHITAIDLVDNPVIALEQLISARGLGDRVHTHYGVDQGDAERLASIIDNDHGVEPLDYVVDDASHFYRETRTTFEVLFPRLRPGGVYVVEDWAWAHFPQDLWQAGGGWFHDRPALTNLVAELLLVIGTSDYLISDVRVSHNSVELVRGSADYARRITLEDHYLNRGLPFRPLI